MLNNFEELNNLTEEERRIAVQILTEYSQTGTSEQFRQLVESDFKEIPVDVVTFFKDPNYLGKAWHLPNGKCKLFPYWENKLKELFPDSFTTACNNAIFSGARGLGKSEIAVGCGLYLMYRLMCLKNPYEYLNLKPTEQVAFAFMNITEALAIDIGISKFQKTVQMSPWFMSRGTLSGKNEIVWNPPKFINIIIGSQPRHVIGQAVYFAFFDEISFIPNQDVEKQKTKAIDMIDTAIGGMKTRFTNNGKNPTLLVLASSKRSEKSFLETHMKKKLETEGENTFIVDEPVWNIRPASEYSGKRFYVAQGNKFLVSEVIPEGSDINTYINRGYRVIDVPVEYRADFLEDIDRALCDFAGISSSDLTKYIAGFRVANIKKPNLQNLFIKDVIEVGNSKDDTVDYWDFIDLNRIDRSMLDKPLYVHMDMSLSGDKTGIAGTWIVGKKPTVDEESDLSKDLYYRLAFSVSIKAPKGYQVSLEKNRRFIRWLRNNGFNVKGVSTDTYQSADTLQVLEAENFNCSTISVDRVDSNKLCVPYHTLRTTIYEERVEIYDSLLLTEELLGLERASSGKIDHPDGGKSGSKDISDAFCGSLYNASQHADEFAFDFGETLDIISEVSSVGTDLDESRVKDEFEKELMQTFTKTKLNVESSNNFDDNYFLDFGRGKAQSYGQEYLSDGIIIL